MKYITIAVDDKSYAQLMAGKRVEGTVGLDLRTLVGDLNAYNRKSREPGYVKPKPKTLYETQSGRLNETAKTFNIYVSAKKSLGRERCASELLEQTKEMANYLFLTKTIEELLNEI
ncbi:MAG: hypothetical protein II927_08630 [Paludibacteraceae bacterium]|nr:hypothetical protein [Paludibacteraceae bacterium]